jgi:transposase-like protein
MKHVLGIWVQQNRGREVLAWVCAVLATRDVRDILIACCDGLSDLPEPIEAT